MTFAHPAKKYNKMVFYVEACESGSMFKGLLDANMNVFATTASNATTSSFACYFDKVAKMVRFTYFFRQGKPSWAMSTPSNGSRTVTRKILRCV